MDGFLSHTVRRILSASNIIKQTITGLWSHKRFNNRCVTCRNVIMCPKIVSVCNVENWAICFCMPLISQCNIDLCWVKDQMHVLPYLLSQDFAGGGEDTGTATGNRRHTWKRRGDDREGNQWVLWSTCWVWLGGIQKQVLTWKITRSMIVNIWSK